MSEEWAIKNPDAWLSVAFDRIAETLRYAPPGGRNVALRNAGYKWGRIRHVANGSAEAYDNALASIALETGLSKKEVQQTLGRAIRDGRSDPTQHYVATDAEHDTGPKLRIRRSAIDPGDPAEIPIDLREPRKTTSEDARAIWRSAVDVLGTPAEAYLRQRGIDPRHVAADVRYGRSRDYHYVIFPVHDDGGDLVAVQRVSVDDNGEPFQDESGRKRKLTTGPAGDGAFVALDTGGQVIVCEGPEDALSIAAAVMESGETATVKAALTAPTRLIGSGVTVFADNDQSREALEEAAKAAGARLCAPEAPHKDANDVWRANGAEGVMSVLRDAELANRIMAQSVTRDALRTVAPRRWLYGNKLIRGFCTVCLSPGGTGKSSWTAAIAVDMAKGAQSLHDAPHGRLRTWIYNLEDPRDETLRKLAALDRVRALGDEDLDRIRVNSGRDRNLIVAHEIERGVYMAAPDVDAVIDEMRREKIDVLIVDPAVRSHRLPENDNKAIDVMMDQFARIAHEADAAVLLVHHSRKGFVAGEMDSARGASSMMSAARVAVTLQTMQPEEAVDMNVPEVERRFYVRIDNAKANLSPPSFEAEWLKLESQNLDNGSDEYPDGDSVQVVTKWEPPSPFADLAPVRLEIMERIERGFVNEDGSAEPWGARKQSKEKWVGYAILASFPNNQKTEKQAAAIVGNWLKDGFLVERKYTNAKGNERTGVFLADGVKDGLE